MDAIPASTVAGNSSCQWAIRFMLDHDDPDLGIVGIGDHRLQVRIAVTALGPNLLNRIGKQKLEVRLVGQTSPLLAAGPPAATGS